MGIAVPAPAGPSESVQIRKISNGYLITRSGTRRGKYFSEDEYSAGRPVISGCAQAPRAKAPGRTRSRPAGSGRLIP